MAVVCSRVKWCPTSNGLWIFVLHPLQDETAHVEMSLLGSVVEWSEPELAVGL